ncbi:MAG: leucine-rich repeat domain-containing protein [Clostridia bacterium]|nr:leucine-rich repeat domain-containing protein [Clostridia bacterium]
MTSKPADTEKLMTITAKNGIKRLLCLLLALITALAVCSLCVSAKNSSSEDDEDDILYDGDFCYIVNGKNALIVGYTGKGGDVVIPEELGGLPAAQIRRNVFLEDDSIISVHLPAAMKDISEEQFCLCSNLKSVTVAAGNKVYTSVDGVLFSNKGKTIALHPAAHSTEYDIPEGVTRIGGYCFFTNKKLARVTIPSTVREIGRNAFYDCEILRSVYLPDSVKKVEAGAFSWCLNLKELRVPDKLSDIGRRAFFPTYTTTHSDDDFVVLGDSVLVAYLGKPYYVVIPSYVKTIADVFYADEEVEEIVISEGVKNINDSAFFGCSALEYVTVPDSVEKIGDWAFYGCVKLRDVHIPDGASVGAYAFGACEKLKSAAVNCEEISTGAFEYCPRLSEVTLGSNVKTIGSYAFYGCEELDSLTIPDSVTEIGGSALRRTGITKLTLSDKIEKIGQYAFSDNDGIVLTVTDGTYAYKYAKKNGYEMKVKQASSSTKKDDKKKDGGKKKKEAEKSPLLKFYEEYKTYIFIGGGALILLIALLVILLVARKRRKRRRAASAEPQAPPEPETSAEPGKPAPDDPYVFTDEE